MPKSKPINCIICVSPVGTRGLCRTCYNYVYRYARLHKCAWEEAIRARTDFLTFRDTDAPRSPCSICKERERIGPGKRCAECEAAYQRFYYANRTRIERERARRAAGFVLRDVGDVKKVFPPKGTGYSYLITFSPCGHSRLRAQSEGYPSRMKRFRCYECEAALRTNKEEHDDANGARVGGSDSAEEDR